MTLVVLLVYKYMCVCIYIIYVYILRYLYICLDIYIHTNIQIYVYMHVYVYMHTVKVPLECSPHLCTSCALVLKCVAVRCSMLQCVAARIWPTSLQESCSAFQKAS